MGSLNEIVKQQQQSLTEPQENVSEEIVQLVGLL